eukprot:2048429-Prymnesium_polylepis.1
MYRRAEVSGSESAWTRWLRLDGSHGCAAVVRSSRRSAWSNSIFLFVLSLRGIGHVITSSSF